MSFLSDIATALAIILVSCGVNLTEISGGEVSVPTAIATEAPATTESATPEPTAESETDPAQPAALPEATAPADVQSAQSAVAASFVTEAEVESDVQTLATQMYASSETQETSLTFTLKYANNVSGRKIVSIDINGDADYDTLKSALDAGADVSAIDASVDSAISALN